MTTYTAFVAALAGLTVTGVKRSYGFEPDNIDTADLPGLFVRLPSGGTNDETMTTCSGDGKMRVADLVVIIEPTGQSTTADRFADTVTMADRLETALDASSIMPFVTYTIESGYTAVPGYLAVVATVTGIE